MLEFCDFVLGLVNLILSMGWWWGLQMDFNKSRHQTIWRRPWVLKKDRKSGCDMKKAQFPT